MKDSGGTEITPGVDIDRSTKIKTTYVEKLDHPEFELRQPLPVFIKEDEHNIIANYAEIELFGCGSTEAEAISDLMNEITETYLDLEQEVGDLSSKAKKWWNHLQKIIIRK